MDDASIMLVNEADFESAALPHLRAVAHFALSLTRNRADADDLVQETYLRACSGWHTFRPGSDPRRWLFAICRNAYRLRFRRRAVLVNSDDGDVDAMPAVASHLQAIHRGLEEMFDLIDVRPAIERAIDQLPEPHHSVLALVDLQGLAYEEVAAILGIPIGTVRSRLFRARRIIQESLIDHAADAGLRERRRARTPRRDPVPC